ncbi:Plasmodium exported protein (Pm-fam-a like), unknown function [Plasmodium malariae]|uniref:Fam-l protein n=1 Tax=Plasmodium malariae TaxID=5858 RepID=A0A1A8WS10_PLAMA|nr:Plasmodium exported protein (Pm-fam-a like), unknown function [Plasmodium malariae]
MSRFNKILDEKHGSDKKLYKRIDRLLGKCEKSIFANVGDLELNIPYNTKRKNEEIFKVDNEKFQKEKKEKLDRSLLYKEKLIKQLMKNKCTMLHKSYNHYEKKIMNGLDDKAFFNKILLINDKDYKKLKFNKILDEKHGSDKKLYKRIYRLLGKCEKSIFANVGDLELNIPYNTKRKNEEIFKVDNEKFQKEKKEKLDRSLLYKEKLIKQLMKNKCTMLHKSYNHYEKKIMNGLDDKAFFNKILLINDKDYKKLKYKKYRLRLFLLSLLFLVTLVIPVLDLSIGNLLMKFFSLFENNTSAGLGVGLSSSGTASNSSWITYFSENLSVTYKAQSVLIYCVPILIMGILLIIGVFYYYKNVIKHKKVKFLKSFNE